MSEHIPVLLKETLDFLELGPGKICIDATFGGGGHSREILSKLSTGGRLLAIDADKNAISKIPGATIVHGNFRNLETIAKENDFEKVDAILFDLGVSSDELDNAERGFSFQKNGPLDMRFDQTTGRSAAELLAEATENDLVKIFKEYGEERFAKKIARAIILTRGASPLVSTAQLFELIKHSLPGAFRHKAADSARRIFQALRIAVNKELENLQFALPQAEDLLAPGGRLAVISFHSLEDRIVKRYFIQQARDCVCPPEFPKCVCGKQPTLRILTKKPVTASAEEVANNSRAKSAKLRVALKV